MLEFLLCLTLFYIVLAPGIVVLIWWSQTNYN